MGADEKTSEIVAFACAPTWEADHPAAWLEDFTGHLQGDRYAGHAAMLHDHSKEPIVPRSAWLGRGMHLRARVEKAAKSNDARAVVALAHFKAIYRIEASWKAEGLSSEARRVRREVQSIPQVDELYRWTHQLHPRLVPNTPLFEATRDAINQEAARRQKGPSGMPHVGWLPGNGADRGGMTGAQKTSVS